MQESNIRRSRNNSEDARRWCHAKSMCHCYVHLCRAVPSYPSVAVACRWIRRALRALDLLSREAPPQWWSFAGSRSSARSARLIQRVGSTFDRVQTARVKPCQTVLNRVKPCWTVSNPCWTVSNRVGPCQIRVGPCLGLI